jgi:hypothetical protein
MLSPASDEALSRTPPGLFPSSLFNQRNRVITQLIVNASWFQMSCV